jgi:hypothetical protein
MTRRVGSLEGIDVAGLLAFQEQPNSGVMGLDRVGRI